MSGSLNKVQLIGNLGRDPEVRYSGDGKAIANLTVATTEKWKDKAGKPQEKTEWHRVVMFGPLAEVAEKYLKKGASAYFEGKLQTRKWTDQSGNERYTTEIVVDQRGVMQMLGGKSTEGKPQDATNNDDKQWKNEDSFDDDIPF